MPETRDRLALIALLIISIGVTDRSRASQDAGGGDWPQWRGPRRSGIASPGPKLLERWPEEGPKLLWESEKFPGLAKGGYSNNSIVGGCGSVSVVGERAYYFAHCQFKTGNVSVTTGMLERWGWGEGVTEELSNKVREARSKRPVSEAEQEAYLKNFLAALDPSEAKAHADFVARHLKGDALGKGAGVNQLLSWKLLGQLAAVRDKPFGSVQELAREAQVSLNPHAEGARIIDKVDATGERIADLIFCLDAKTGKQLWRTEFPGGQTDGQYHFPASGTPAVADGKVYVAGSAGTYCVAAEDGKELWKAATNFTNSSPLVLQGLVVIGYKNGLVAYDAQTGAVRWKQEQVRNGFGSATPWEQGGNLVLIVGTYPEGRRYTAVAGVNARDGSVLWQCDQGVFDAYTSPAIDGNLAVLFNKGNIAAIRLGLDQGARAWVSKERYDERGGSVVVHDGYVYSLGGGYRTSGAHCHDLKTGETKWIEEMQKHETGSPILADGKLIAFAPDVGSEAKEKPRICIMYRATPEKYEELGRLSGKAFNPYSSPSIAAGRLYLRCKDTVACYDLRAP
ncbi:MAG: PQQ-like beta-propeller repeat protein [Planctomycetota bacterium]|nr:PQQ-like beta-propeller repeat protein [Planctomycetota bacterium]